MWAEQITNPALNQAGINNFNNCVVLAIQLIAFVWFYCRTRTVLGCVVHNRAIFYKNVPPKTRLTDYRILIISTQVTKQLKYLGPVEAIFKVTGCIDVL